MIGNVEEASGFQSLRYFRRKFDAPLKGICLGQVNGSEVSKFHYTPDIQYFSTVSNMTFLRGSWVGEGGWYGGGMGPMSIAIDNEIFVTRRGVENRSGKAL